jgi:hypothetical protein
MCGDLEPEDRLEGDLYQRFLAHAHAVLDQPLGAAGSELSRHLDSFYADLLQRCRRDSLQADVAGEPATGYRLLAMQSLALARLAGFLAGHVALQEDPMRKVMEALMHGYQEAEHPPERDHHGPADAQGHDHGGHSHGRSHGHAH